MSKFINELQSQILDQLRPARTYRKTIPALECSIHPERDALRNQVRIQHSVKWEHVSWIADGDNGLYASLHKNVLRQLINDIYGDFRELLLQLEHALYEEDLQKALDLTRQLHKEIGEQP